MPLVQCSIDGCSERSKTRKMCKFHYQRWLRDNPETKRCSFDGCDRPVCAKGLCNSHWSQVHKGQELRPILTHETPEERFERNIRRDEESGCWVWVGSGSGKFYNQETGEGGYGQLRVRGKNWMAHRWAYEQKHGVQLTSEDTLDHLCRNTRCCNPDHLERVSRSENIERMHLYWTLRSENDRFRAFIETLGFDPEQVLGGDVNADVSPVPGLS